MSDGILFPRELLLCIFDRCDTRTLGVVSQTCKFFYVTCQPKLERAFWTSQQENRDHVSRDCGVPDLFTNERRTELDLCGVVYVYWAFHTVVTAFPKLTALRSLDLSDNHVVGDAVTSLLKRSIVYLTALRDLNLSNTTLDAMDAASLAAVMPKLVLLERVILSFNPYLSDKGMESLSLGLSYLTNLQTLNLYANDISDVGAKALAQALPSLTAMRTLDISGNNIGDDGAKALSQALPSLTSLWTLDLGNNKIGDDGAVDLAQALPSLKALRTLDLINNQIGVFGITALQSVQWYVVGPNLGERHTLYDGIVLNGNAGWKPELRYRVV